MSYSRPEGKTKETLKRELQKVYDSHYAYTQQPGYDLITFDDMVRLFAEDDFYKEHLTAKAYLNL